MNSFQNISRRQFIRYSKLAAVATVSYPYIGRVFGANDRINVGAIGAGGKGSSDTGNVASLGENIIALCDVDKDTLAKQGAKYPEAARYQDYRKMLDRLGKSLDAVTVSTPDHHHAFAASLAMKMGKHVYVQKPLTQSVYEARYLRQLAKEKKVATQMGNQGSAGSYLRRAVEVIQAGLIGKPLELHVWSNRPIWPQGIDRPEGEEKVPENLDWDIWIGPAQMRPYSKVYQPFAWRGWKDFGTGALGDMACHTVNMPFRALKLGYPNVVECEETSDSHAETYPKSSRLRFEFPAREGLPPLKFWWYDGSPADKTVQPFRPHADITNEIVAQRGALPASGCLIIGENGKIFSPDDYGSQFFFMVKGDSELHAARSRDSEHEAIKNIPQTIPRIEAAAGGGGGNGDLLQKKEWIEAIRGGRPAYSNFDIAAYLTEIILLGCVALRVGTGKKIDWDGPNMKSTNVPEASKYVKRDYRAGWEVG